MTRDEKGQPVVMVVGNDGKLQPRVLTAPRTVGQDWLVTAGLKPGDKVVVEGAQNLQPGTPGEGGALLRKGSARPGQPPAQAQAK